MPSYLPRARRLCRFCAPLWEHNRNTIGAAGLGKRRQRAPARHARTPLGVCACVGHARGAGVPSYLPRARRLCRFCAPLWEHNRNTIRHNRRRRTGQTAAARATEACTDAFGRVRVRGAREGRARCVFRPWDSSIEAEVQRRARETRKSRARARNAKISNYYTVGKQQVTDQNSGSSAHCLILPYFTLPYSLPIV